MDQDEEQELTANDVVHIVNHAGGPPCRRWWRRGREVDRVARNKASVATAAEFVFSKTGGAAVKMCYI